MLKIFQGRNHQDAADTGSQKRTILALYYKKAVNADSLTSLIQLSNGKISPLGKTVVEISQLIME